MSAFPESYSVRDYGANSRLHVDSEGFRERCPQGEVPMIATIVASAKCLCLNCG